ncbi:MAG: hypothetical protein AAF658_10050, partial [Myxococcota bacterium]
LVERYLSRGKKRLSEKQHARAIEDLDRVLALVPKHREVEQILAGLNRRDFSLRVLRYAGLFAAAAVFVLGLVAAGLDANDSPPPEQRPIAEAPRDELAPVSRDVPFTLTGRGDLFIDGELAQPSVEGPLSLPLLSGPHTARFTGPNGEEDVVQFEVPRDDVVSFVSLDVRPKAVPPTVTPPSDTTSPSDEQEAAVVAARTVTFKPANVWVNVFLDDAIEPVRTNEMGAFDLSLNHGVHRVRFVNPNFKERLIELDVSAVSPPEAVVVRLEPRDARLLVRGGPDGALVEIKESDRAEPIKVQPINDATRNEPIFVPLVAGEPVQSYVVVIRARDGREQREILEFRARQTQAIDVRL